MRSLLGISLLWALAASTASGAPPRAGPRDAAGAAGNSTVAGPAEPRKEIRGLWVVRHSLESAEEIRAVVSAARENGFNALFVQVRGRGEAYYESVIDPPARPLVEEKPMKPAAKAGVGGAAANVIGRRAGGTARGTAGSAGSATAPHSDSAEPDAAGDAEPHAAIHEADAPPASISFDPLRLLVELAHEAGMEVHAWVNVYFTWSEEEPHPSARHVLNRHPEWITADGDGVRLDMLDREGLKAQWIEGIYLSPAIPEVRRYLTDVVLEIAVNYPVDGIHLDYLRYPGANTGLDEYSRGEFSRTYMFDPLSFLAEPGEGRLPVDMYWAEDLEALWRKWRAEQVTALVSEMSGKLRVVSPGVVLSAAVKPDPILAADAYGQDWVRWLEEGYIDVAAPMIYTKSTAKFFRSVRSLRRAVPDSLQGRLLAGISLYNQNPRHAAEKIDVARAAGLGGFILFSYDSVADRKGKAYLPSLKGWITGG